MPNKTYALEWLSLALKNLETAKLLLRENHFTDSIAIEIQQSVEKAFKSIYAYWGKPIPRTHALPLLFNFVREYLSFDELIIEDLIIISDYYETERYPGPRYSIPPRGEVEKQCQVAESIYKRIDAFVRNQTND